MLVTNKLTTFLEWTIGYQLVTHENKLVTTEEKQPTVSGPLRAGNLWVNHWLPIGNQLIFFVWEVVLQDDLAQDGGPVTY